jgi:hypothetical protein
VFFGIRYTKALQDILNTEGGKLSRDMVGLSTPAFGGKIEAFAKRNGRWGKGKLSPQDAAVASVTLFGIELASKGQTSEERLAGSSLRLALIDYSKQNPSSQTACEAALKTWVEVHEAQKTGNPPKTQSPPQLNENAIQQGWLQGMAESAASFMTMQGRWIQMMPEAPEFDGPVAAAFAYGVWDSITQKLNNDEFTESLLLFASKWMNTDKQSTIEETANAMLRFGHDSAHQDTVIAGGRAFQVWIGGPKGDFFPVHLGQCMIRASSQKR